MLTVDSKYGSQVSCSFGTMVKRIVVLAILFAPVFANTAALAQSEASSEASSAAGRESPSLVGGRGYRRWYRMQQMQQQRAALAQQKRQLNREKKALNRQARNTPHVQIKNWNRRNRNTNTAKPPTQ